MSDTKQKSTGLLKLFQDQLQDVYYVEKQLVKALPKMAKAATNAELRTAFEEHLEETKGQVTRLEKVFDELGIPAKAKKCPAIEGILEEGNEIMDEFSDDPALDAGLIDAAQKVEHYEIATYGSLCAWAELLELDTVKELLGENLEEEKAADESLSEISGTVNQAAITGDMEMANGNGSNGSERSR